MTSPAKGIAHPPRETVYAGRLFYAERNAKYSTVAVVALTGALIAVCAWTNGIYRASLERRPLVVGIDSVTKTAYVLRPESLELKPGEANLRGALMSFVKLHCERVPATVEQDYLHSLLFMDRSLTGAAIDADQKEIAALLRGEGNEIRVQVANVSIASFAGGCQVAACRARVDFTKMIFNRGDHTAAESKQVVAEIGFLLAKTVSNDMVESNPLGLIVTDYHESPAFR